MHNQNNIDKLIIQNKWKNIIVYDLNKLEELYKRWQTLMPHIMPYYAIKCNPSIHLLKKLAKMGSGFDCASLNEIEHVLKINVNPQKIIFSNPCKYEEDIHYALKNKVYNIVFDSLEELQKIHNIARNDSQYIKLILRIYANDKEAKFQLSKKYGAIKSEWENLLKKGQELQLNITGVSFHIGSSAKNSNTYNTALKDTKKIIYLAKQYGYNINLIDIGGGFSEKTIASFSKVINDSIKDLKLENEEILAIDKNNSNFKKMVSHDKGEKNSIMAEPGRYFAESIAALYTQVFGKKLRDDKRFYWVAEGIYGCFNCELHHELPPKPCILKGSNKKYNRHKKYKSTIFGPTCDIDDMILSNYFIEDLDIGDYLVWKNMGAYTIAAATNFNGINEMSPVEIVVDKEKYKVYKETVN